jgi:hypothetical protein
VSATTGEATVQNKKTSYDALATKDEKHSVKSPNLEKFTSQSQDDSSEADVIISDESVSVEPSASRESKSNYTCSPQEICESPVFRKREW